MTLYELGKEYLERSVRLTERIRLISQEGKKLDGNRLLLLKRRIYSLYSDAAACRKTAERLMAYYERMDENG